MAKNNSKTGRYILLILVLIAGFAAYKVFGPNTGSMKDGNYLYIKTGAVYADVKKSLEENGFIADMWSFELLAKQAKYPSKIKAGRYKIEPGMSNYRIIRLLGSGRQEPVKLVINKLRTKQDFIHFVSTHLEADSNDMQKLMADASVLSEYGLDANTAMCAVIPDTYEFFWNTSADKAFKKIAANYKVFWNDTRKQKAAQKNITPVQATIIASIVEEETNKNDEKQNVASVYINRLKKGMKLEADPTVKFALNDFTIKRVTGVHLQHVSPYNTYIYTGLPPGPICTPSKASLDAVINANNTDYIFFCAKEDFSGYHRFASNYTEHLKNAKLYRDALDARGIK